MLLRKKVVIGDGERGLEYVNRRFERVLLPGVYRFWYGMTPREVRVVDTVQLEYVGKDVDGMVQRLGDEVSKYFVLADVGVNEVGLLSINGKLVDVLAPGTRKLYWRVADKVSVELLPQGEDFAVPEAVAQRLRQLGSLSKYALAADVPAQNVGLVFINGKLAKTLPAGAYAFWNFAKNVVVSVVDLRVQGVEVSGQEMLTRDKVSLRVNLAATFRVIDAVAWRTKVVKAEEFLYRELQFGLRKVVSARTLDELLGDKASLDADVYASVRGRVVEMGAELLGVGVKDIILPGEMRDILNMVVQTEKAAQANVIRRREEANAMRSALNTARLMQDSPILMRLKELETLEKVTEKIGKLTVFGGLEGVLTDLVKMKASV